MMTRLLCPSLLTTLFLADAQSVAQHAQHDDVEVIDAAPYKAPDEKKPDLGAATKFIVEKTNAFRATEGRAPVAVNAKLAETAEVFAAYMAETGRYGHTADGSRPADRAVKKGYEYCIVLENIAYAFDSRGFGTDDLGKKFVEGWQKSPGHRRNMLDPDVTETAVAIARSEKTGYYFAVQMFGRPKSLALKFQIENRAAVTVSYRIGEQAYELQPRYTRTHEQCRPTEVVFELPTKEKATTETIKAADGSRFVLSDEAGTVRVRKQ
jgi:uncharacterized protein YkwD